MNVLMVSDVYFPRINGVSTSIETFTSCLSELDVKVSLIAPSYEKQAASDSESDRVTRIPSRQVPLDPEDRFMSYKKIVQHGASLKRGDFDVVHIQTPFVAHYAGVHLARRLDVPVIATYHTFFEEYLYHYVPALPKSWTRGLARRFSRGQCNTLDGVIVPSTAMRERLGAYGVTVPLHVLPTGIPLARFSSGDGRAFRERHDIPLDAHVCLFVGRVAHEKNIRFLLQAALRARNEMSEIFWLITGEGPALASLKREVAALGLSRNVRFLGYLDRSRELIDCYAAADAFVFSSVTETQGLVLLEAMAMGVPVVALSAMGTADILASRRGAVVPENDPVDFARCLVALFKDKERHARLSAEARVFAQEWSDIAMARRLKTLYETLREQHSRRLA